MLKRLLNDDIVTCKNDIAKTSRAKMTEINLTLTVTSMHYYQIA